MTEVPTLAEMRHALSEAPLSDEEVTPTLAEMMHANALYQTDPDAYLEHYGVKGMKWGVRRSRELLARVGGSAKKAAIGTKDEEGNVVGGIRAKTRAGAQKLKDMRDGSTIILEDADGATKVMSKQKDGTFKEVYLSADAERVLQTTKKAESELSDAEINKAINRAKKIEEYNKLFNPQPNPNADLQTKVDAMKLEISLREAQRTLNPPKKSLVNKFIGTVEGGFGAYNRLDKAMNGKLNPLMKEMIDEVRNSQSRSNTASRAASSVADARAASKARQQAKKDAEERFWSGGSTVSDTRGSYRAPTASEQKRVDDFVYNITTLGREDTSDPYYDQYPSDPEYPPYYPALERKS